MSISWKKLASCVKVMRFSPFSRWLTAGHIEAAHAIDAGGTLDCGLSSYDGLMSGLNVASSQKRH